MEKLQRKLFQQHNMNNGVIDLVIRIKNGYLAKRETIESPHSMFREEVLKKLKVLKYIYDYQVEGEAKKNITITLRYDHGEPAFTNIKIHSRPGRRWYVSYHKLKPVLSGMGYSILSTPKGVLTNIEARKDKVGGELLFDIW